jgi:hypothetical protein
MEQHGMPKKRPARATALRAQQNGPYQHYSDEEEDLEQVGAARRRTACHDAQAPASSSSAPAPSPPQVAANRAQQRSSTRRIPKVDFGKLEVRATPRGAPPPAPSASQLRRSAGAPPPPQASSLQRYRKLFKLGDAGAGAKEELIPSISRHFATQVRQAPRQGCQPAARQPARQPAC